ncbi:MAG: DUF5996 family protein [Arenicellales bacterium]
MTFSGSEENAGGGTGWPALPAFDSWQDTAETLHMWLQVAGKIRLKLSPWINHSWGSALYVTARGLTTSPIPYSSDTFSIDFDFIHHALRISTSKGESHAFPLQPMAVADFYRQLMDALYGLGIDVKIFTRPVEIVEAIRFEEDRQHASYDAEVVNRYWRALVQADRVFKAFRAHFAGKSSPVHLFWGGFDLAVTRFSGRTAPRHPGGIPNCADWVMWDAYSHEVASAGMWAGAGLGEAAFYAYAYPEPAGFSTRKIEPATGYYSDTLHEFILPYEAVRTAADPEAALTSFLQSTYEAAADLAGWDRTALECVLPPTRRKGQ